MALRHMVAKGCGELTTAKEICQIYRAPFDVTAKVLQQLAHHNWLAVEHGVKGGYRLQKDLSEATFLDLVEILMGPAHLVECLTGTDHDCQLSDSCHMAVPLKKLNEKVRNFYAEIRVLELVAPSAQADARVPFMV